jgi:hypothetical protein
MLLVMLLKVTKDMPIIFVMLLKVTKDMPIIFVIFTYFFQNKIYRARCCPIKKIMTDSDFSQKNAYF